MDITKAFPGLLAPVETRQERDARMEEFHKRFPSLAAVVQRIPMPCYRSEASTYGEGRYDDD